MTFDVAGLAGLVTALGVALGWVIKAINRIRANDLRHIDIKVDELHEDLKFVRASLRRVEDKIDRHLEAHVEWGQHH